MDKIYLGNIYGEHIHDGFGGAVFDVGGVVPQSVQRRVVIGNR